MIVVGFYTDDFYGMWAQRLRASVLKRGYVCDIQPLSDRGSHNANVHQKSLFIHAMLDKHPSHSILYIDSDAEVVDNIHPLDLVEHDFAGVFWEDGDKTRLLGGTLLFKNNERTKELVRRWIITNREFPNKTDQENLQAVLESGGLPELSVMELHPRFCWLESAMRSRESDTVPAIFHYGVSRAK